MTKLEQRFEWLKKSLLEGETSYPGMIKDDIANYLDIENIDPSLLETLLDKKFDLFQSCENEADIEVFIGHIISYVTMKSQNEELIAEYLATKSDEPLRVIFVK